MKGREIYKNSSSQNKIMISLLTGKIVPRSAELTNNRNHQQNVHTKHMDTA